MPFLAPAIALVAGAVGSVGSFFAGLGLFGKIAIGLGLNLVSAYLDKKAQEKAKKEAAGVQFDKQYGQDVPRQVPVGMVGQAGHDCYVNTWDKSNKRLQNLYILGDWPSGGLTDRIGINGKWEVLGPIDDEKGRGVKGEWENLIWVRDIPGSLAQPVDPYLLAHANPQTRWTAEHRGIGMAMAVVTLKYDQEKNNQFPEIFFENRGSVFYDFRKDSSVGGSGSHRWNDVSTWETTRNPMVALYCYMRGLKVGDDLFCGMGILAADLPLAKWSLAMSLCDEIVEGEPRYQVSAILDCGPDATHATNVESLLKSCGGYMMDGVEGIWPVVGSDQPIVATLTDDDIVRPRRGRFQRWRSQGQLVNKIAGTYPNPENLWAMEGYPAQIATNLLPSDRRSRDVPMDFPMVPSKRQAAQLASIYLLENRLEATASWTLKPRWMGLEAGDWIRVNSKRYGDFTYLISESVLASLDSAGPRNINVELQERNGSIYDATANPDILFPPIASNPPDYLSEVQNFSAVGVVVDVGDGKKYVAIRTQRDPIEDDTVVAVDFRYWPTLQPGVIFNHSAKTDVQVVPLVEGVVSKTQYQVQTRLVTDPPRVVPWAAPFPVTTPDQPYTDAYPPGVIDDVLEKLDQKLAWIGNSLRVASDARQQHEALLAESGAQSENDKKEIKASVGTFAAEFRQDISVVATATAAAVFSIIEINARMNDPATGLSALASITNTLSASVSTIDGELTAVTDRVDVNEARIGNVYANGILRFEQVATLSGALSTAGLSVSATAGGATSQAAAFLSALSGGLSEFLVTADRFAVISGGAKKYPLIFQGGVLYLNDVRANMLSAISSTLGNVDISNAIIGNLIVGTSNLGFRAVTANISYSFPTQTGTQTSWTVGATATTQNPEQVPVFCEYGLFTNVKSTVGFSNFAEARWRHVESGAILKQVSNSINNAGEAVRNDVGFFLHDAPAVGTNTYVLEYRNQTQGPNFAQVSAYVKSVWWKK